MPGEMWDRTPPRASQLEQLAEAWTQLHSVNRPNLLQSRSNLIFHHPRARFEAILHDYAAWSENHHRPGVAVAAMVGTLLQKSSADLDSLADLPSIACFCRSDARFANVVARPDG